MKYRLCILLIVFLRVVRKIYWPVAVGMSLLSLITQGSPTRAEIQPVVSSEQGVIAPVEVVSEIGELDRGYSKGAEEQGGVDFGENNSPPSAIASTVEPKCHATWEQTKLATDCMEQVTSVSQLADVQPTDWAFQALQSLIERYGVIAGYPDATYRGNRAMTRYEFAAGLNAALERVNELVATGVADLVSRQDLATLQRLQQEFAPELASLRGRVDNLEARTAELEANQFSTTTKLIGQVVFAVSAGGFNGDRIVDPRGVEIANDQPNTTVLYRAALDFNTSFRGTDLLKIRLDTGSPGGDDNTAGFLEPNFGSVLDFSVKPPLGPQVGLSRLHYTFAASKDLSFTLGPALVVTDFLDFNSYAFFSFRDFSTQVFVNNFILFPIFGPSAGAVANWKPGQGPFTIRAAYVAADPANPSSNNPGPFIGPVAPFVNLLYPDGGGDRGVFGDPNQGTVELEYFPSKAFAVRLQYSGGNVLDGRFDVFGANVELALSRQLAIFGRYGNGSYDDTAFGNINPSYWMAGASFRDLFLPGALAGIAAGQPFIEGDVGNATQTNLEAFYNFPINDNIQITPLVQVIIDPANQDSNGTIITGTLRTFFAF